MSLTIKLPAISPEAQQVSDQLIDVIKAQITVAGGQLSFADFMQLCLYHPSLGYYSAGSHKLGSGGDFITAPEISALFSQSLAQHICGALKQCQHQNLLEFGAGSGKMAIDILQALAKLEALPDHYYIIEVSADLRLRQHQQITAQIPQWADRVIWLTELPEKFSGVMVANEVCDAMPVQLLSFNHDEVAERTVGWSDGSFVWQQQPLQSTALRSRAALIKTLIGEGDYHTEVNLQAEAWLQSLADRLEQGALFIIDYGYPQPTFYHPQRQNGSLMCYFQHQGHDDPFVLPGLQDITAHLDFTALAEAAHQQGMTVSGFQSQADFLIAGEISQLATALLEPLTVAEQLTHSAALKRLLLPDQMGENFKVLTLTRQLQPLSRNEFNDRRHLL